VRATRREGRRPSTRVGRPDGGQATVELAVVLPLVVVLLVLVLQIALVARDQVMVVHAAREAARSAAVAEAAGDRTAAATRAADASGAFAPSETVVVTELLEGGRRVKATVRHTNRTDLPLVGALLPDMDLEASAVMRVERR
jgi:Flp pilus assembly protein TadG